MVLLYPGSLPVIMAHKISVVLADDHTLLRGELRRTLEEDPEIAVIGEAANGAEAVALAEQLAPDVVVMDVSMPVMDGIQATRRILERNPAAAILMLSLNGSENCIRGAAAAGARGYVLKDAADLDLVTAVKNVASGRPVMRQAPERVSLA